MKLSKFNYDLPQDRLAFRPTEYRDQSRLLVLDRKTGKIEHKQFKDLVDYFDENDVIVVK